MGSPMSNGLLFKAAASLNVSRTFLFFKNFFEKCFENPPFWGGGDRRHFNGVSFSE